MANRSGKATAITVLTPMSWWKSYLLKFLFRLIGWGFFAEIQRRLIKLSFIHFAHWSIVKRGDFPHLSDDQPLDHPHYDYLFFVSNFNGSWDQYIDAFSEVVPIGLDNIWRWSQKFPGSVPEDPFFKYIRHNQFSSVYYYNAVPSASATDISQALTLNDELFQFYESSKGLNAAEFAHQYQRFLMKVQNTLGEPGLAEWQVEKILPANTPSPSPEPALSTESQQAAPPSNGNSQDG